MAVRETSIRWSDLQNLQIDLRAPRPKIQLDRLIDIAPQQNLRR